MDQFAQAELDGTAIPKALDVSESISSNANAAEMSTKH